MRIPSSNEKKKKKQKQKYTSKRCWSKQEDDKLISHIKIHGEGSWSTLPKAAGLGKCGKSCRVRWIKYLRPHIKRGNFTLQEEDLIIKLHALLGNRWSLIAGRLPGRTDNEVKNYWNSQMKRKLMSAGIDPNNHRLHQIININTINTTTPPAPAPAPAKSSASLSISTSKQKPDDHDDDEEAVSSSSSSTKLNLNFSTTLVRPRAYSPAAAAAAAAASSIKFSQKPTTS